MNGTELSVRLGWDDALTRWENGEICISYIIEWGFIQQDLLVLGCLHQLGKHCGSIEDLLEDCNYHMECGLLHEKKYDEYFNIIFEEN